MKRAKPYPRETLYAAGKQRTFKGSRLLQIAMPLGGIGAGCVCLNGYGGLSDYSIRHKPATSALPDGHGISDAAFAIIHITGKKAVTRLVEGPIPVEKIYNQGLKGQGYREAGYEGMPRFRECTFTGEYPFGFVDLSDPDLPLRARITAFNPFIPLDDINSGLPCAILEYGFENVSKSAVDFEFSYHLSHLAMGDPARRGSNSRSAVMPGLGVFFNNVDPEKSPLFGSGALGMIGVEPVVKAMWYRGGWFDAVSALWREVDEGRFTPNDGSGAEQLQGRSGGSILVRGSLQPGETVTYPVVIAWHFPNVPYGAGQAEPTQECNCAPGEFCDPCWKPYYTNHWQDAGAVARYVQENYVTLRGRTQAFHDAMFDSDLPAAVLDAVSANLAILKSPTVLRQSSGNVWAWEGCFCESGCCHGTCTHVWNYAQAMPHLFPALERTLREQELGRSMNKKGHVTFRAALPDGRTKHDFHAAADGQLGGIMKVFREWQISGDRDWLENIYPMVKRSMDFCIEQWDPRHTGLLEEPHHNTYDIEFWGPDGMTASFYLGALSAMTALARDAGHQKDAPYYADLASRGSQAIENLFNGEYYEQHVAWEGLSDTSFADRIARVGPDSPVEEQMLKAEGPKYQYGAGCLADGVLGAWMARRCGVLTPQNQESVTSHLKTMFEYNFRPTLWDHSNTQRFGFAAGDEPGLLLCTWPRGGKPTFPFPYSDEVWTGIEYQVASHLIEMGLVDEGLTVVSAARSRYDGRARNPWNEYECGNYYARAMSSYALLTTLSGFRYAAPERTLSLAPKMPDGRVKCFFSTASGWGSLRVGKKRLQIQLVEGELPLDRIIVERDGKVLRVEPGIVLRAGEQLVVRL